MVITIRLWRNFVVSKKRIFNPANKEDILIYMDFLKLGTWREPCPFILENPHLSVPHMINEKIIKHYLKA
jgi:hypothetical protein